MDKLLRNGLVCMVAAVVLMPLALLFKTNNTWLTLAVLVFTMLLELIGLIFVSLSILQKRKAKAQGHD